MTKNSKTLKLIFFSSANIAFISILLLCAIEPLHANSQKSVIIGSGSSSGSTTSLEDNDFDILVNPSFPSIVLLPETGDKITKKSGVAFPGSNPTYEARSKVNALGLSIKSVDITDSKDKTFKNIPFMISHDPINKERIIIGLTIPKNIATGDADLLLHQSFDTTILNGSIKIIDFLKIKDKDKEELGPPEISKLKVLEKKDSITLSITGKNFAQEKIFVGDEETSSQENLNTVVTVFPASAKLELEELSVSKSLLKTNLVIKAEFKIQEGVSKKINAVICVATPRGIVSKSFVIRD